MEKVIEINLKYENDKIYTSGLLMFSTEGRVFIKDKDGLQAELKVEDILTVRIVDKPINEINHE